MYGQTGDILYKKVDSIPNESKKINGNLIHKGNDHLHLIEGKFELYENGSDLFIDAKETCFLTHEEHHTKELEKGIYKKDIVMEYDHWLEESRQVID